MSKISTDIKNKICHFSKVELEKLVLKAASRDKGFHDYLIVNYFDKTSGEQDLFKETKNDLENLFRKSYRGFSEELKLANMLSACLKRINEFGRVCKNKNLEADLIMYVLEIPFSLPERMFRTCFRAYNYKVGLLVKKAVMLTTSRMHEDYKIEYRDKLNLYLEILHRTSSDVGYVDSLSKKI